ncbi:SagB-type dehydrogenase domain protein [Desulfarculus baarsii DSM 2075]|uniref:SagB-type dehydrogenase domain protein n=1 Tax=Desulfarculus baarsii (strain ATCC 33931 / DSM 2075 / LMG 7858 / VKM B-1802 / 2st14) TaxID=644282 RepID=E1QE85_DESB2|nr:SagB/ThcOx family dehydrogenase [Desulfarculus baarsii]ADK83871.1 SagB-type dehydrogenase domain protein [Desulfarculus baarsii DSM 2075]
MSSYHDETAYDPAGMEGHVLDWANQPSPFKFYKKIAPLPMPEPRPTTAGFWEAALAWPPPAAGPALADSADLAGLLQLAAGLTKRSGPQGLRAWASAGALHPCELYLAACDVDGAPQGLCHFDPASGGLHLLWPGRLATHIGRALAGPPARLGFFISAIHWRSLWKYRQRAYRYCLLDAGHLLANLELACAAHGLAPRTILGFPDTAAGVMAGVADRDEAIMAIVQAGPPPADPGPEQPGLPPLDLAAKPLGAVIGRDRRVLAAHAHGELFVAQPEPDWPEPEPGEHDQPLPPPTPPGEPSLWAVVHARRSRRNFVHAGLERRALATLLAAALPARGPMTARLLLAPGRDLAMGVYDYLPDRRALRPVVPGVDSRAALAQACLGQGWIGRAALTLCLWADLEKLERDFGPRAYRRAMIAAGRAGQRLYLAATALGLGCCGVGAFYDERAARAAALPPGGRLLYALACGPVKGWPGAPSAD